MPPKPQSQKRLRWFAIRAENKRAIPKVQGELKRLGVKAFIPMAYRQERRGKWLVSVPDGYLFPPYIFVAMRAPGPWKSPSSLLWGLVAEVRGVAEIMGYHNSAGDLCPVAIPYREMRKIRTMDRAGERRKVEARFKAGQTVRVVGGTFSGFDAIFDRPEKERVRVLLSLFGRQIEVVMDESDVKAA